MAIIISSKIDFALSELVVFLYLLKDEVIVLFNATLLLAKKTIVISKIALKTL
jgi:hypothetical protein